jgi:hypothetical protein
MVTSLQSLRVVCRACVVACVRFQSATLYYKEPRALRVLCLLGCLSQ